jgi:hypothetical protein
MDATQSLYEAALICCCMCMKVSVLLQHTMRYLGCITFWQAIFDIHIIKWYCIVHEQLDYLLYTMFLFKYFTVYAHEIHCLVRHVLMHVLFHSAMGLIKVAVWLPLAACHYLFKFLFDIFVVVMYY